MSKPISPEHSSPTQPKFRRVLRRSLIFVSLGFAGLALITSVLISIPSIQLNLVEKAATALTSSTGLQASIQAIEVNWWTREVEIQGIKLSNGEEKPLEIDVLGLARPRKRNGQWELGVIRIEGLALQLDSLLSMSSVAENSSQSALWGVDQLKFRDIRIAYLGTTIPISDGSIDHLQGGASWGFESLELNIPSPEAVKELKCNFARV